MAARYLRFAYACEFLIALIAIFTAWSEVGGQAALDLMHWGWKFGFGVSLAASFVAYSAALVSEESIWTIRSARWLVAIGVLTAAMGIVTYYYALEEGTVEPDDSESISMLLRQKPPLFCFL